MADLSDQVGQPLTSSARRVAMLEEAGVIIGYFARVVFRDLTRFDHFLEHQFMRVPGIRSTRSSFTLRSMIRRIALPLD